MRFQVLDVLQKQHRRPLGLDNIRQLEKQIPLRLALEAMSHPETLPLRNAGYRKRLTRKTCGEHIMVRNIRNPDIANVIMRPVTIPGFVGLLRILVPFTRKPACPAEFLESAPEASDTGKEINERERQAPLVYYANKTQTAGYVFYRLRTVTDALAVAVLPEVSVERAATTCTPSATFVDFHVVI